MNSQMTTRQVASKEVIKSWMNLYVRLLGSTDIYWNICFTPGVGKTLCLVPYHQPLKKNPCWPCSLEKILIKEHQTSFWVPVGLSSSSPFRHRGLRAYLHWGGLATVFLLHQKRRATGQSEPLLWPAYTRVPRPAWLSVISSVSESWGNLLSGLQHT